MDEVEHAVSCFKDGFSCSQAVLSAYGERFGMDREMALKVSGAFGGGIGSSWRNMRCSDWCIHAHGA
ncbi:MAG: C-GCAxxG-C-C family protein [Euryarchaeota archaeon]|nr:C-GCAxxG-C-C family protein [Euryarchaeota archaeon]